MNIYKKKISMAEPTFSSSEIKLINFQIKKSINNSLSMGPNVKLFQDRFAKKIGAKYAIATNSCTSALEIALQSVCKLNDEVLIPGQTFIASAMAAHLSNLKIKFVEIDQNDFCIDFLDLKKKISKKTKAIILVNMGGNISNNLDKIKKLCNQKKIYIIEDAAHSLGAKYLNKNSGTLGDIGCFSFYPTKIITTGEGGMLTTNNKKIASFAKSLQLRGRDLKNKNEQYVYPGRNVRMPEISAILGLIQLNKLDSFLKKRRKIASVYLKGFKNNNKIKIALPKKLSQTSCWKIPIILNQNIKRDSILEKLNKLGIMADKAYFPPVHQQPIIKKILKIKKNHLPKTENLSKFHICLPCHQNMSVADAKYVVQTLNKLLK